MAFVPSTLDAEADEKRNNLNISGTSAGPEGSMGGAGVGGGGGGAAPSSKSGGFTNIQDYLGANQESAEQLGSQVAGNINQEAQEAETALSTGVSNAQNKIQTATRSFDDNQLQGTIDTGVANDWTQQALRGDFSGPNRIQDEDRTNITRETQQARDKAALTGSQGGRIELLRGMAGGPQATGVTKLNSAFLQGNEAGRAQVDAAVSRVNPLVDNITAADAGVAASAQQAAANNANIRQRAVGGIGSFLDTQTAAQDQRLTALRADMTSRDAAARAYLSQLSGMSAPRVVEADAANKWRATIGMPRIGGSKSVRNSDIAPVAGFEAAGLTEQQARDLQQTLTANSQLGGDAIDVNRFFTNANQSGLSRASVTSAEDAQRLTALAQLAGRDAFTSSTPGASGSFDFSNAIGFSDAQRDAALQRQEAIVAEAARVEAARVAAEEAARAAAAAAAPRRKKKKWWRW